MLRKIDWDRQIGRRIQLRDLHVFSAVVEHGSMAKAAAQLGVSQPAVSEVIAGLEHTLGVRLLDRSPRGIEPTIYGVALLKRSTAAFDELRQGIRDIEFLADPTSGELKVACPSAAAATLIPHIVERFIKLHPRVVVHFDEVASVTRALNFPELRARTYDLVLARGRALQAEGDSVDDFNVDVLFDDQLVIVAGPENKFSRRRRIDLSELVDEPWIMHAPYTWNHQRLAEAFRARGLPMPRTNLVTISIPLLTHFLSRTPHITACPKSVARFNSLSILPVDLPARPWPVGIVTLKHRTLSPLVERFIMCAREVTGSITGKLSRQTARGRATR